MANIEVVRTHEEEEVFEALAELNLSSVSTQTADLDQTVRLALGSTAHTPRLLTPSPRNQSTPRISGTTVQLNRTDFISPRAGFDPPQDEVCPQSKPAVYFTQAIVNVTQSPYATPKRHTGVIGHAHQRNNNLLMIVPGYETERVLKPERILAPLNTYRLKPISERVKKTGLSIRESGTVCIELFQPRNNIEVLVESLEVSSDGQEITVMQYKNTTDRGNYISSPRSYKRKVFTLDCLPQKFHKKYEYARRFVNLVKSKTPKIIMYNKQAKCMLMENFPDPCFMAKFYNGKTYLSTWRGTQLLNENEGKGLSIASPRLRNHTDEDDYSLMKFAKKCHKQCLQLEGLIKSSVDESKQSEEMFPVILGRRRAKIEHQNNQTNSTFVIEDDRGFSDDDTSMDNINNINHDIDDINNIDYDIDDINNIDYENDTNNDNALHIDDLNDIEHDKKTTVIQTEIPDIGLATQLESGAIWIQFADNSHLGIQPSEDLFAFVDKNGVCKEYTLDGDLPDDVRKKLALIPNALDYLYDNN
ncbi:hypothetical protein LOTGIDRAFT_230563 [Lottia gigantea]|uniref:Uncharacterized protein n=1 Tax=Lottia gigantea TaxID=225164 RepID=V4AX68_LOTGI|nr:hypothetical protein LOTGIDRAFT_230563 [Lottia gigantea]ESP02163.1 hypothetical protein LOTGIDRAFT_230563 [Lottia gigantea]